MNWYIIYESRLWVNIHLLHHLAFSIPSSFFSTQKRVNRDKTDLQQKWVNCDKTNFTTKKHEFYTCGGILHITHMPDVEKFQISPHLSYGKIWNYSTCGEISDFSTFITHRNLKFLHMTNFSPHVWQVIQVTNIRYDLHQGVLIILILVLTWGWWQESHLPPPSPVAFQASSPNPPTPYPGVLIQIFTARTI